MKNEPISMQDFVNILVVALLLELIVLGVQ